MILNHMLQEALFGFCETYGYSFHKDYSGRAMYGQTCIGLSFRDTRDTSGFQIGMELALHIVELHGDDDPELIDLLLHRYREDQLGLGGIIYWPGLKT